MAQTDPKLVDTLPPAEEVLGTMQDIERAIEAILFAAGHPVDYDRLASVIGLSVRDLKPLIEHMAEGYADRGIQLLCFPDSCQLCTREVFAPYIREALGIKRGGNLSASSMEVLAVVAYNQPVTRAYINTIRGVDSAYAVSSLLDKGLIEAVGRLDAPGQPMLYGTTDKFLRVFGLPSLADLPETEALDIADTAKVPPVLVGEADKNQLTMDTDAQPQPSGEEIADTSEKEEAT